MESGTFHDLRRLLSLRAAVERLDPTGAPRAILIDQEPSPELKRIGILSGAFNPPTIAHLELAARSRESFRLDRVLFLLSRATIDKKENEGLMLEDRLLLLSLLARELGWASAAVTNRGLYFEQAGVLRTLMGAKAKLFFIVGMDKVAQIFDPRYYENRNEALVKLFIEAQIIAASRAGAGEKELQQLVGRAGDDNYADRVYFLPMPDQIRELASSAVRGRLERGEGAAGEMPEIVREFVAEADAFRPGYDIRRRLLAKLYGLGPRAEETADLRALAKLAGERTAHGAALARLLDDPASSAAELERFLAELKK